MAGNKNELKQGVMAMFSSGSEGLQEEDTGNSNQDMRNGRPFHLCGRHKKGDTSELLTKDDRRTTLIMNRFQFEVIKEIARRERVTIKQLILEIFTIAIQQYESTHGIVEIEDENDSHVHKIF